MLTSAPDFLEWVGARQSHIESILARILPDGKAAPQTLHAAMRYAVLGGGKRVRPLLAFAAGEACRADPERVALVAAAIELIHAYSLVHDDLPCMDDDGLRRGKPSCHVEYGEATALLAGDSLQSLAFQVLGEHRLSTDPRSQLDMIKLLATASGSRGMAGGQAIDLASIGASLTLPELEIMHIHKTGALIRASVLMGAYCGDRLGDSELAALDRFAKNVGLAFQVVDDVLDSESNTATLGKTAGKDVKDNKPTYVSALGLSAAREHAQELKENAVAAVSVLGERAARLKQLAEFIVSRKF